MNRLRNHTNSELSLVQEPKFVPRNPETGSSVNGNGAGPDQTPDDEGWLIVTMYNAGERRLCCCWPAWHSLFAADIE